MKLDDRRTNATKTKEPIMSKHERDQAARDAALAKAVQAELEWHALIDATQLAVDAEDNVVTVVGTVPSMAEKLVVLGSIDEVDGVHGVVSRIDVKSLARSGGRDESAHSDEELNAIIEQSLRWNALVPEDEVEHTVSDGWVTLAGMVPTARQRTEAERVIAHILGVRGVTNEIGLAVPTLSPGAIRDAIVEALERHAAHQARDISVVVDGNRVTLSGSVESALERRAVLGAVSHAPGVEAVCEELLVRPRPAAVDL